MADRQSQPLVLRAHIGAGVTAVTISGELDVMSAPALRPMLADVLDARPRRLIFDLTRVDYIDCAAARAIVRAGSSLPAGRRVIIRPSPVVRKILDLTGLSAYCEVAGQRPRDQHGGRRSREAQRGDDLGHDGTGHGDRRHRGITAIARILSRFM